MSTKYAQSGVFVMANIGVRGPVTITERPLEAAGTAVTIVSEGMEESVSL